MRLDLCRDARFSGTELDLEKAGDASICGVSITNVGRLINSLWNATISTSGVEVSLHDPDVSWLPLTTLS